MPDERDNRMKDDNMVLAGPDVDRGSDWRSKIAEDRSKGSDQRLLMFEYVR